MDAVDGNELWLPQVHLLFREQYHRVILVKNEPSAYRENVGHFRPIESKVQRQLV